MWKRGCFSLFFLQNRLFDERQPDSIRLNEMFPLQVTVVFIIQSCLFIQWKLHRWIFNDSGSTIRHPFGSLCWWTAMCWQPAVMYRQSRQGSLCQSLRLPGACLVCKQRGATRLEKYAHRDLSLSPWNVWITRARSKNVHLHPWIHTHTHKHTHAQKHTQTKEKFSGDKANNWQKRPRRRNPPSSFSKHFKGFSSDYPPQVWTFDPNY